MRYLVMLLAKLCVLTAIQSVHAQAYVDEVAVTYHDERTTLPPQYKTKLKTRVELKHDVLKIHTPGIKSWTLKLGKDVMGVDGDLLEVYIMASGLLIESARDHKDRYALLLYDLHGNQQWSTAFEDSHLFFISPDEALMLYSSQKKHNGKYTVERQLLELSTARLIKRLEKASISIEQEHAFGEKGPTLMPQLFNQIWMSDSQRFLSGQLNGSNQVANLYDREGKKVSSIRFKHDRSMQFFPGIDGHIVARELVAPRSNQKQIAILYFHPKEPEEQRWKMYQGNQVSVHPTGQSLFVMVHQSEVGSFEIKSSTIELLDQNLNKIWADRKKTYNIMKDAMPFVFQSPDGKQLWRMDHQLGQKMQKLSQLTEKGRVLKSFRLPSEVEIYWNPKLKKFIYELKGKTFDLSTRRPVKP